MSSMTPQEVDMARLIVEVLNLEDVEPAGIEPEAVLFADDGLGLDSIDALEIAVAIAERYDVHLSAEDEANRAVFATLKSLTDYVAAETA